MTEEYNGEGGSMQKIWHKTYKVPLPAMLECGRPEGACVTCVTCA